jgi:tetratricopeptide (TPR) repeat protein
VLEALPPSPQLALAYRMHAHLRMLNRDFAEAIQWGEKSIGLAEKFQEISVLAMAYNTVGSALMFSDYDRGCAYLEQSLHIAREHDLDFWVANAYSNLGAGCGELYQFQHADEFLAAGMAFCAERDLDVLHSYMVAWQALSHLQQGRWSAAREDALLVLQQPTAMTISRITALLTLGRLYARQGDTAAAAVLDEALELARQTETVQRLAPVHAARAEAAWLSGERARTLIEARAVYDLALSKRQAWFIGELILWRWYAGERVEAPTWTAEPFAFCRSRVSGAAQVWASGIVRTNRRARWPMAMKPPSVKR